MSYESQTYTVRPHASQVMSWFRLLTIYHLFFFPLALTLAELANERTQRKPI